MGIVSLCVEFPNLDTMAFYVVFVFLIPYLLFSSKDYDSLKYYMPLLVMVAVTLTEAGKPDLFKSLYESPPTSVASFLSRNTINALALTGIMVQTLQLTLKTNNLQLGLVSCLVAMAITFPIAQTLLVLFIKEGSIWFESLRVNGQPIHYPGKWHKYFLGFLFTLFLILCEYLIMTLLLPKLTTSRAKNSVLNNLV